MQSLIGLGSNASSERWGEPVEILERAVSRMATKGLSVVGRSSWWRSAPIPPSDPDWYINGVAAINSDRNPDAILETLAEIEREFGRIRRYRGQSRTLDLDLLACGDFCNWSETTEPPEALAVPHPRMHRRAFVLAPLVELDPHWRHPIYRETALDLLEAAGDQKIERLADGEVEALRARLGNCIPTRRA